MTHTRRITWRITRSKARRFAWILACVGDWLVRSLGTRLILGDSLGDSLGTGLAVGDCLGDSLGAGLGVGDVLGNSLGDSLGGLESQRVIHSVMCWELDLC
jgi:hypothetical protein